MRAAHSLRLVLAAMSACHNGIAALAALRRENPGVRQWEKDFSWLTSAGLYACLSAACEAIDGSVCATSRTEAPMTVTVRRNTGI